MQKHSRQRDAVYSALCSVKTHPTASEVYEMVRSTIPNISLATVYRNLSVLSLNGKALALNAGDGQIHYDGDVSDHSHMFCEKCRRVVDIDTPLRVDYSSVEDCEIHGYSVMFYGVCGNCLANPDREV